ncbi:hypothetical protein BOX15_Mlig004261g3, partial [Macrostomum lignano]
KVYGPKLQPNFYVKKTDKIARGLTLSQIESHIEKYITINASFGLAFIMSLRTRATSTTASHRSHYQAAAGRRTSFGQAPKGHHRFQSSASSDASCSDSNGSSKYLSLGHIGATRTHSQTSSPSSECSFNSRILDNGNRQWDRLIKLAVRDANSSNRQQSTRRRSRRHDSMSPQPIQPVFSPPPSPTANPYRYRRGRSAGRQHEDSISPAQRWNDNSSNQSKIYDFRPLRQQRQRRTACKPQLLQQHKHGRMMQEQQPNKIYAGNHAESNVLLNRKLNDSLRRLQSQRRSSRNLVRCNNEDRWTSFYGKDESDSSQSEQEERPLPVQKAQQWVRDRCGRDERARELEPSCDGARGCMRETRSHRETLFSCPFMALSLTTKIYECDKCATKYHSSLSGSRARMPWVQQ